MKPALFRGVAGLALLAVLGCSAGETPLPVSGVVTVDGKPQADVWVQLNPTTGGRPASGQTDAEGRCTLTTSEAGDGAVRGAYRVTFAYAGARRPPRPEVLKEVPPLAGATVGLSCSPLGQGPLLAASALLAGRTALGVRTLGESGDGRGTGRGISFGGLGVRATSRPTTNYIIHSDYHDPEKAPFRAAVPTREPFHFDLKSLAK